MNAQLHIFDEFITYV